ncbi:hypothetical protein B0H11DRAFT_93675 [Mycena galericulata]|nr:hypothetical protein B0H11DRAFT_93675 [Mycena galericulata]
MPSFLSKVFGRKKDDTKESRSQNRPSSDASLLEGKFEAVPPVTTPTSPGFDLPAQTTDKEKAKDGFGVFRSKSNRTSPVDTLDQSVARGKVLDYHLSLNLPGPKEESTRALGVVFEADPDAQILLPDSVIAERKLSPLEAFLLVQACSQAINARGLETLGIMIPHWYSASPSVQRKLISLFIQSLALKSPITTLSPTASSPVSAFESEISTTRSPHDVAAVLRWGLRHLQLDNSSFGKDEQWYSQFLNAERTSEYPPRAFTEKLVPLLPPAHLHLLTAILEIFSSLAAHAEANSISGSKLSKMLGLWILATPHVTEGDDYLAFYEKWEKWGRTLEHLFLARIRDEAADHRMPTRLTELVKHYPYAKSPSPDADLAFLPSPRFSTRRYDALFVRIETEMPSTASKQYKNHPLRLIADALKASSRPSSPSDPTDGRSAELELWESLKKNVSVADADSESYPGLSSLFADETIRFLSLIPSSWDNETKAEDPPPFTLFIPSSKVGRRRSMSLGDRDKAVAAAAIAHAKAASAASAASTSDSQPSTLDPIAIDWSQFSTSGFFSEESGSNGSKLAATLLDNKDVEITIPRKLSAKRKLPPALIPLPSSRGKSLDLPPPPKEEKEVKQGKSRAVKLEIIQLDEAFVDFWSDALLDPISADWPAFVICKIKSSVPAVNPAQGKRVGWLIIEQQFITPGPPPVSVVGTPEKEAASVPRPRPNSPKPSFGSDSKSTKKKRFSFFTSLSSSSISSSSTTKTDGTKGKKKAVKGPKIGEMGEILKEEEEPSPSSPTTNETGPNVSSAEIAAVATGAAAAGAAAAVATVAAETPKATEESAPALVEDAANTQVPPTKVESQTSAPVEVTPSLVEDVGEAQVAHPTEPPAAVQGVTQAQPSTHPEGETTLVAAETPAVKETVQELSTPVEPAAVVDELTSPAAVPEVHPVPDEAGEAAAQALLAKEQSEAAERERVQLEEEKRREAEQERLAAEEAERARVERERLEEQERSRLEEERLAEERRIQSEKDRIAVEEAAQALLAKQQAEVAERERLELERLEEEKRLQAEQERLAAEEAERARVERERLEEQERLRLEEERLAEERRVEAEQGRLAAEEAERVRLTEEKAEQERLELEKAEQERLEEERRLAAEEAERVRLAEEKAKQERLEREKAEQERLEEERRLAAEEAERVRLAEEKAEQERLEREKAEQERLEEERRLAAEEAERVRLAEKAEKERLEEERRLAAEAAERVRLAQEKAEQERLEQEKAEERRQQAEKDRIAAEEAESARLAAEQERLEQEKVEEERRQQAERAEHARLAAEKAQQEVESTPAATAEEPKEVAAEPAVMVINDEPVAIAEPQLEATDPVASGEEAATRPIIEPAAPSGNGLQFDTSAEVIGGGHTEPLRELEAANDKLVELPAVPVVEARPDLKRGPTVADAREGLLPGGETPGPQAALSIAEEPASDDVPAYANGNGHGLEDADKAE